MHTFLKVLMKEVSWVTHPTKYNKMHGMECLLVNYLMVLVLKRSLVLYETLGRGQVITNISSYDPRRGSAPEGKKCVYMFMLFDGDHWNCLFSSRVVPVYTV